MDSFYGLFPKKLRKMLLLAQLDLEKLQEIRFRIDCPVLLKYEGKERILTESGDFAPVPSGGYRICREDLAEMLEVVSGYSMYAFDEELKQGFLTVPGGHRIGVAGKIVRDGERIQCIRHIAFFNIRLSHQVKGCADKVMRYVYERGAVCHTLIISPPGCGKTTLLRDMIRQISNGTAYLQGQTVGVVDERSELAGSYLGVPQNDLGIRTDVMDGCAKAEGMMMLLRSMSPQVIAVDELGSQSDGAAVERVFHCGCKLLATVHGNSVEDVRRIPLLNRMIRGKLFERYIVLEGQSRPGAVREILDSGGKVLWSRGGALDSEGKVLWSRGETVGGCTGCG